MSFWFFVPPEELQRQKNIALQGNEYRHLKAARLKPGEDLVLADGRGRAFAARLLSYETQKQSARVAIMDALDKNTEPPLAITLFLGLTRGEKMDRVVRQTVELGVKKIVPVLTERSIVTIDNKKGEAKTRRWQSIAYSAAAQCRRSYVPDVSPPLFFDDMLPLLSEEGPVIVPWEEEKKRGLRHLAAKFKCPPRALSVFTGPEGGITPAEMEKLAKLPCVCPVTLGPRILRAETAPLAMLAVLLFLWGDLAGPETNLL